MKILVVLFLALFLSFPSFAGFIADTDIPLMDELVVNEDESFSFDTPAGQIITFVAKTDRSAEEVRSFYQATLQGLGWLRKSSTQYVRDQDELSLQVFSLKNGGASLKIQCTFVNK